MGVGGDVVPLKARWLAILVIFIYPAAQGPWNPKHTSRQHDALCTRSCGLRYDSIRRIISVGRFLKRMSDLRHGFHSWSSKSVSRRCGSEYFASAAVAVVNCGGGDDGDDVGGGDGGLAGVVGVVASAISSPLVLLLGVYLWLLLSLPAATRSTNDDRRSHHTHDNGLAGFQSGGR